jgi:hypothetical protein
MDGNILLEFDRRPILFFVAHAAGDILQIERQFEQLNVLVSEFSALDSPLAIILYEFLLHVLHAPLQQNPIERILPQELLLVLAKGAKDKLGMEYGLPNPHQKLIDQMEQPECQGETCVLDGLEHEDDGDLGLRYFIFPHLEQLD